MNSLATYEYKSSKLETIFIPILNEIRFFENHSFNVYNCYTNTMETVNFCLVMFLSDIELQVRILYFGNWLKSAGCNVCTKESTRHDRKFFFPTVPIRGTLRSARSIVGVSGKSILRFIEYFNLVKQTPNDTMHVLWCNGVFFKLLNYVLTKVNVKELQAKVNGLRLSDEYGRAYKPLSYLNKWKAKEMKTFSLLIIPLAHLDLEPNIVKPLNLFRRILYMLSNPRFSREEIKCLKQYENDFHHAFIKAFTNYAVTRKVHRISHHHQNLDFLEIRQISVVSRLKDFCPSYQMGRMER